MSIPITRELNRWTGLAAALLVLLALPFALLGVWLIGDALIKGHAPGGSGGLFEAMVGFGAALLLIGAGHLAAAAQTWRQHSGPGSLARAVGVIGLLLGSAGFAISLFTAQDLAAIVLLFPVAYFGVLVAQTAGHRPTPS